MIREKSNIFGSVLSTLLVSSALVIGGCADSLSDDFIKDPGSGGTGSSEPIFSVGVISEAAVLRVNDLSYNTDSSIVFGDFGQRIPKENLVAGMVVELDGQIGSNADSTDEFNGDDRFPLPGSTFQPDEIFSNIADSSLQGRADVIRVKSLARGTVDRVVQGGFMVNGGMVSSGASVNVGQDVEVFGLFDRQNDRAVATLISEHSGSGLKTTGVITALDTDLGVMQVNGVSFDISNAVRPTAPIATGALVQVFYGPDTTDRGEPAAEVRLAYRNLPQIGAVSLQGIVETFESSANFTVEGVSVNAAAATVVGEQDTVFAIQAGARVQVLGRLSQGRVVATQVTVLPLGGGVNVVTGG